MAQLKKYDVLIGKTVTTLLLSERDAAIRQDQIAAADALKAGGKTTRPRGPRRGRRTPDEGGVIITPGVETSDPVEADEEEPVEDDEHDEVADDGDVEAKAAPAPANKARTAQNKE